MSLSHTVVTVGFLIKAIHFRRHSRKLQLSISNSFLKPETSTTPVQANITTTLDLLEWDWHGSFMLWGHKQTHFSEMFPFVRLIMNGASKSIQSFSAFFPPHCFSLALCTCVIKFLKTTAKEAGFKYRLFSVCSENVVIELRYKCIDSWLTTAQDSTIFNSVTDHNNMLSTAHHWDSNEC